LLPSGLLTQPNSAFEIWQPLSPNKRESIRIFH
jgi:hypothetical protein